MKLNPFNEKVLTEKANKHGEELDSLNASISFFDGEKAVIEDLREVLRKELVALHKGKIEWYCQCPPELMGAELSLVHLLGYSWKKSKRIISDWDKTEELLAELENDELSHSQAREKGVKK